MILRPRRLLLAAGLAALPLTALTAVPAQAAENELPPALRETVQTDYDLDGLDQNQEAQRGTDPNHPDTDGDGIHDGRETRLGTDPTRADSDDDGRTDAQELVDGTDPLRADTDGDGMLDGQEGMFAIITADSWTGCQRFLIDPLNPDQNGNGILDGQEVDTLGLQRL